MYYRIYGVMSTSGFHTELFQTNTKGKALESLTRIPEQYPFFAITEHKEKGHSALGIQIGLTKDKVPLLDASLVEYKTNPMLDAKTAEELFTKLGRIKDAQVQG